MTFEPGILIWAIPVGLGAALIMDSFGYALRFTLGWQGPRFSPVGRWVLHMPSGVFAHNTIAEASPKQGEMIVGWSVHFLTAIGYALVLLVFGGSNWLAQPDIILALLVGGATIVMPFCVMYPALGFGLAMSKTPAPWTARRKTLINHTVFGLGMWVSGLVLNFY